MDIEQLRTFRAVAERGSFAKGGDELFLTRSSARRHVDVLEAELGVALFSRTSQGVALTEAGEALLAGLAELLPELDELFGRVRRVGARRCVRMAFSSIVPVRSLSTVVSRYAQVRPEVSIELRPMSDAGFVDALVGGAADVCVWYATPEVAAAGLEVRAMRAFPLLACYVAKGHPLARRDRATLPDLRGQRVMCRRAFLPELVATLEAQDVTCADGAMSETGLPEVIRFVQAGGVHVMARGFSELVGCVEVPLDLGDVRISGGVLHRPSPPGYLDDFIALLAEA